MSLRDFSNIPVMRKPDGAPGFYFNKLERLIEEKYNTKFNNYWEFHKWTTDHLAEFWSEFWDFVGIVHSKRFDEVIDCSVPMSDFPEWFKGAKLNYAENLLKFRDNRTAIIEAGEDKDPRYITFAEMYEESRLYAAAFRKFGIKKGDVVACYVSNRPEALFAMHATTSIGAIWTGALPLFGAQAVLYRMKQVNPRILLTIDRFPNDREEIDMLPKVKEVVNNLPSLEKVLIIPSKKESKLKDISDIRNSCFLDDFLKLGLDENGAVPEMEFEQVSFSHPVFINFTSGTTGLPKAMMHGSGALMPTAKDFWLQMDSDRDSIWFSMSPVGWVSWNMTCALHFCGIGVLLYEGVPYYLSPTYFWDLVDKHKLTHLFLPANVTDDLEKFGYIPTEKHDLSNLKAAMAGGSIVKPQAYDFFYNIVKKDIFFCATYGSTEVVGTCISMEKSVPIYRGESPVAALAVDMQCVNEEGKPIEGEYGELIIGKPAPFLLLGLWGDSDGSRARKSYYEKFPVDMFPEVRDCICVSQYNKDLDERAVLFLKMTEGFFFNDDIVKRIQEAITKELTSAHIPDVILETQDIPYSINGKKMEIIVKNIINKRPYNKDNVMNPECLKNFCDIPILQQEF
ncbi:Acetoacetyl-CoA synthetase [Araneus ventricosus]|uniref:Acetoacetyl-CoA synthetase n=1 Tax=Araneus ventricosus TaxID=182803 RepID=A0A4Y2FX49_ARAVE|nr:Acetoacetyl-CoA synthetase [Araneus ventricosus]